MKELIRKLHNGDYSCVIANHGIVRTFTQRGVADLYDLLMTEPDFLNGACMADKVVGKGAAALMVLGKVKVLYADVISASALMLLCRFGVQVEYKVEVPFIWNRNHTDRCPVETLCDEIDSIDEMWLAILEFVEKMKNRSKC